MSTPDPQPTPAVPQKPPLVSIVVLIVAIFLVMAALLAVFSFNTQDNFATLRNNQTVGLVSRQQQMILDCAIWESKTPQQRALVGKARQAATDKICHDVGNAVPTTTATPKG